MALGNVACMAEGAGLLGNGLVGGIANRTKIEATERTPSCSILSIIFFFAAFAWSRAIVFASFDKVGCVRISLLLLLDCLKRKFVPITKVCSKFGKYCSPNRFDHDRSAICLLKP